MQLTPIQLEDSIAVTSRKSKELLSRQYAPPNLFQQRTIRATRVGFKDNETRQMGKKIILMRVATMAVVMTIMTMVRIRRLK